VEQPLLSVVIITWNDLGYIRQCLESLSSLRVPEEIIVVDNGSTDGTVEVVNRDFPAVRLLVNESNRGVAKARNQGIKLARGRYLLLLDSDTVVARGSLEAMVDYLSSHPDVGLVGPRLVDLNGDTQLSCRRFPTLWTAVFRRLDRLKWFDRAGVLNFHLMREFDHESIRQVDYVIGACQLISRESLDSVGLLDERIFFGPEDIDFCLRLWQSGWKVVYFPGAVVYHAERRRTKNLASLIHWRHVWAKLYFFRKHRYLFNPYKVVETGQPGGLPGQSGS